MKQGRVRIVALVLLSLTALIIAGCGGGGQPEAGEQSLDDISIPAARASEDIVAEGKVVPVDSAELRFEQSGVVDEILVDEGSTVEAGTALTRLDTRDLVLAVEDAEATLSQAKAEYDRLIEGATDEEIAVSEAALKSSQSSLSSYEALVESAKAGVESAEADVARANGQLSQTRGQVTPQDIEAANLQVEQARLALIDEEDGPKATDVQQSQASLDQVILDLKQQRDSLSSAKTSAKLKMEMAANRLRDIQANYSGVYWDNREIERDWDAVNLDLPQKHKDQEESALRSVQSAEDELAQARINYENARLAEITGIQVAEARVRELQAVHTDLLDGSDPDVIASARYQLAKAEADMYMLQGEKRAGDLAVAQAGVTSAQAGVMQSNASLQKAMADLERAKADVAQAQANLDNTLADPRKSDLDKALAAIEQREVALKKAKLNMDKAAINAPFEGTVVEVNPKLGEWFGTTEVAVVMADFSEWKIETTDLDELAVVNIDIGSLVRISFDALPDLELPGKVTEIQSLGKNYQGDIVYKVTITPDQWDDRLRWNMTATVSVTPVEQEEEAAPPPAEDEPEGEEENTP